VCSRSTSSAGSSSPSGLAPLLRLVTRDLDDDVGRVVAIVAGVATLAIAVFLWLRRDRMQKVKLPDRALHSGSALAMGAGMTLIDLPTAFPLFVVVGAIVHEDLPRPVEGALLVAYCAAYVLPLAAILVLRAVGGERGERWLANVRDRVNRLGPGALAVLSAVIGLCLIGWGIFS
jgi:cytochrome c biogenesis protein CcdA